MAKKPQSRKKSGTGTERDSKTGRFVARNAVSREATEFADRFTKNYREALRELSKH